MDATVTDGVVLPEARRTLRQKALLMAIGRAAACGWAVRADDSSCDTCNRQVPPIGGPWTITWCEDKTDPNWCDYPLLPNFGYKYTKYEYNCQGGGGPKCYLCVNETQDGCCNVLEARPICCTDGRDLCC